MTPSYIAQLPWVQALGWTLLHFVWQGALIGMVFAALRALIPVGNCNARYANGLAALALMLVFPLVTLFAMLRADMPAESATSLTTAVAATASAISDSAPSAAMSAMDTALQWIVCLWIAGVLLMAYRSWYQWRSLMQIARKWAQPNAELETALLALSRRFEFVRRIKVLVSDRIDTPILIGWFKPVILLPTAVVLGFPRQQVELILAHELGHLRRYDHIVNLAQAMVETLLFYHPVVHWVSREIRNEREICCDTLVLHKTSSDPREYARTLAALEELRQPPAQLALAATGGVLLDRVRRILGGHRSPAKRSGRWPWLFAVAGAAIALLVAMRIEHREPTSVAGLELLLDRPALAQLVPADFSAAPLRRPPLISLTREADPDLQPIQPSTETAVVSAPVAKIEERPIAAPPAAEQTAPASPAMGEEQDKRQIAVAATEPAASAQTSPPSADAPAAQPEPAPAAASLAAAEPSSSAASEPAAPAAERKSSPVAIHTVSPEYPEASSSTRTERVKLEFSIAANGGVRDIQVVSSQPVAFSRAAERALKQWQFAPGSFQSSARKRYAQTFVFASPRGDSETADLGCGRRTGSRLCRRAGEGGGDTLAPPQDEATQMAVAVCDRRLGSRVCNGTEKSTVDVLAGPKQAAQMPYNGAPTGG